MTWCVFAQNMCEEARMGRETAEKLSQGPGAESVAAQATGAVAVGFWMYFEGRSQ